MKKTVRIIIDLNTVLDRIYAESAWRAAHNPDVTLITSDNLALIVQHLESAMADLKVKLEGYIEIFSFNPNGEDRNIQIHLRFTHDVPYRVDLQMKDAVTELLAQYALMRFYGDEGTYFGTAWRRSRAQVMLMLARDQLALKHP